MVPRSSLPDLYRSVPTLSVSRRRSVSTISQNRTPIGLQASKVHLIPRPSVVNINTAPSQYLHEVERDYFEKEPKRGDQFDKSVPTSDGWMSLFAGRWVPLKESIPKDNKPKDDKLKDDNGFKERAATARQRAYSLQGDKPNNGRTQLISGSSQSYRQSSSKVIETYSATTDMMASSKRSIQQWATLKGVTLKQANRGISNNLLRSLYRDSDIVFGNQKAPYNHYNVADGAITKLNELLQDCDTMKADLQCDLSSQLSLLKDQMKSLELRINSNFDSLSTDYIAKVKESYNQLSNLRRQTNRQLRDNENQLRITSDAISILAEGFRKVDNTVHLMETGMGSQATIK